MYNNKCTIMKIIVNCCICLTFVSLSTAFSISWKSAPLNQFAIAGEDYLVRCEVAVDPAPQIDWLRNEKLIENNEKYSTSASGLLIKDIDESDDGIYICRASISETGIRAETEIRVSVSTRPEIVEFRNITLAEDDSEEAELICQATGHPPPGITFRRWESTNEFQPGKQFVSDIHLEQSSDADSGKSKGVLRFTKLRRSDDGLYECIARNAAGTARKAGHIAIEYAPSFKHMESLPPAVYSWNEQIANLSCYAEALPNATIEWRWNDRPIRELNDPNLQIENHGIRSDLLVRPRESRYYTTYQCVAQNRLGFAKHIMQLREARIPDIIPQSKLVTVSATSATFEIVLPPHEPSFPITAIVVQYKERNEPYWENAYNRSWSPDSEFTVELLRPQTFYDFRFAAHNEVGSSEFGAYLQHATPISSTPEPPRILHMPAQNSDNKDEEPFVFSPYSHHFELSWSVPADNGEPIDFYQIKYCPGLKVDGAWYEINQLCETKDAPPSEAVGFKLTDLHGDTYYDIQVKAHNANGFSKPAILRIKTAAGES